MGIKISKISARLFTFCFNANIEDDEPDLVLKSISTSTFDERVETEDPYHFDIRYCTYHNGQFYLRNNKVFKKP